MSLEVEHITKRFAGLTAIDDASLVVNEDETVGLIGPNGAGKTTMFNCILGVLTHEEGTVSYNGTVLDGMPIHKRSRLGIARTFQRMELFATMTPREHLLVTGRARATRGGIFRDLFGAGQPSDEERERAQRIIERVGLEEFADKPVEALTLGQGRLVELGRAMMCEPSIILLDEPSSGLDRAETAVFAEVLKSLRREEKMSLLVVEHDLELVLDVSDRLYCLDFGRMITSGAPDEVMAHPQVREAYLGVTS